MARCRWCGKNLMFHEEDECTHSLDEATDYAMDFHADDADFKVNLKED